MYATAHRVVSPGTGEEGINAFLHIHGRAFAWPAEPWRLPETNPGAQVWEQIGVKPGGNRVRSYLDVLCPDDTTPAEVETALTGLWLELVADEAGPGGPQRPLPNPIVYARGRVVLRFGVELELLPNRPGTGSAAPGSRDRRVARLWPRHARGGASTRNHRQPWTRRDRIGSCLQPTWYKKESSRKLSWGSQRSQRNRPAG